MNAFVKSLILVTAFSITACTPAVDIEAEGESLMQLSRDWSDIYGTNDMESLIAVFAEDAVVMAPGMPPLEGKVAIREFLEAEAEIPGFEISWEPKSVHVAASGDMAYMIESSVITFDDSLSNPVTAYDKIVTVWRKDAEGNWKNVVDMWNEAPPPNN